MSKVIDNEQDELRPAAIDDIPFAIEVNEDEDFAPEDNEAEGGDTALTASLPQKKAPTREKASEQETNNPTQQKTSSTQQLSLREFLFGDFILGTFLRRQVKFILFLVFLAILYISNRYAAQQEIIEEEHLRKELVEKKNYALTQYAELTMMSRQSGLEQRLRIFGDSMLTTSNEPPFVIQCRK